MDGRRSGAIINSVVAAYIDSLYCNADPKLEELREFAEKNNVPVILRDSESLLLLIMKLRKPSRILEIGTAVGYSSCCFAGACDCQVVTLESSEEMYQAARENIEAVGFADSIQVIKGDARETLLELNKDLEGMTGSDELFDIVFIDAAKSHYREFWDLSLPLCKSSALVICDNVLMKGMTASDEFDLKKRYKTSIRNMREFVKYIKEEPYADTSILPVGDGMSVSVIEKSNE